MVWDVGFDLWSYVDAYMAIPMFLYDVVVVVALKFYM